MVDITVEELASALIASFEGCRLISYRDGGGVWTIGIGHTRGVMGSQTATPGEVVTWFAEDAHPLFEDVAKLPVLEAAALVSFGYNCGRAAMLRVIAGLDTIANPMHTTDKHGNVEAGLVNRRRVEELLCQLSQQLEATRGTGN